MVTILFVLGIAAAAGFAVWTSRRTTGTRPSGSNRHLGGSAGYGMPYYGDTDHRHHSDGGSGSDGGGWSGGGGGDGGGGGGS